MIKKITVGFILFCGLAGHAQNHFLVLKKRSKTVRYFWEHSQFTFQQQDGQWFSGIITRITPDSFYMMRENIYSNSLAFDTVHISGYGFTFNDIKALLTKRALINNNNGSVNVTYGHEKFVWVKNGLIFQIIGGGYASLNIANNLISRDPPFVKNNLKTLSVPAAILLFGEFLHFKFDPYLQVGKKYKLAIR